MTDEELRNGILAIAWRDFLVWAIGEPEVRARFEAEAGKQLPRTFLDNQIDLATQNPIYTDFAVWATKTMWGWDEAPKAFRETHS